MLRKQGDVWISSYSLGCKRTFPIFRVTGMSIDTVDDRVGDTEHRDKLLLTCKASYDWSKHLHAFIENRYIRDAVLFASIQQVFGDLIYCTHETVWHFQDLLCAHLEALGELFGCLLSLVSDHYRKDDGVQL